MIAPARTARSRTPLVIAAYVAAVPLIYVATLPDAVPKSLAGVIAFAYLLAVAIGVARLVLRRRRP